MWKTYFKTKSDKGLCNKPLTNEDIAEFQKYANSQLGFFLPFNYAEMLKMVNGYENNGKVIYAADSSFILNKNPKKISGYIVNNFYKLVNHPDKNYLYIGESYISFYIFDRDQCHYACIDKTTFQKTKIYTNFYELLQEVCK